MANCVICGEKISFGTGTVLTSQPDHEALIICTSCDYRRKCVIEDIDKEKYISYFQNILSQIDNPKVKEYVLSLLDTPTDKEYGEDVDARIDARQALEQFGIDFNSYDDNELQFRNTKDCRNIGSSLLSSKLYSFGSMLPTDDSDSGFLMEMTRTQVHQNFILMRQNEQIIRLLQKLADK